MDATDYIAILIEQQEQKVRDLHANADDLHRQWLMTLGAAADAAQDLVRFKAHRLAVAQGQDVPKLI